MTAPKLGLAWFLGGTLVLLVSGWLIANFGIVGLVLVLAAGLALPLGLAILRRPQLGLFLVLFFLPFERIPSLDVGGVTLRLNFLVGGLTLLATALAYLKHSFKPTWHPLLPPIVLLLIAAGVSLFAAVELPRAIVVLAFLGFTASFGWFTVELVRTPRDFMTATRILWWSALVVGVFGIYQFFGDLAGLPTMLTGLREGYTKAVFGFPRVQAFSIEPLYLGNWLLIPLSLLGATVLLKPKQLYRPWLWWLLGLLALILVLTVSRGAYLAAAASAAVIVVTLPRQMLEPRHVLLSLLISVTVLVGALGFISRGESGALEEFIEHARVGDLTEGESTQGRLSAYSEALRAWESRPVTGIGLGNYGAFSKQYPNPENESIADIVNNQYLELLAETGLIGLIAFLLIFATVIVRGVVAYRATDDLVLRAGLLGTTAAVVGLAVQYNFFSTLYIIHIWVLFGLATAVQNLALRPAARHTA